MENIEPSQLDLGAAMKDILVSGSHDCTIRVWNILTGQQERVIEGHTGKIYCVSISANGKLLASKSSDNSIRIWDCNTWKTLLTLSETATKGGEWIPGICFNPKKPLLATLGENDTVIMTQA